MTNIEVIRAFVNKQNAHTPIRLIQNNYYTYKGRTLYTDTINNNEVNLINYSTIIAKIKGDNLYLNNNKYSKTTSKIQRQLRNIANKTEYNILEL